MTPLLEQAGVKYETADDGVYGHFGRDAERVVTFTLRAFGELFGHEPKELRTEIELAQP